MQGHCILIVTLDVMLDFLYIVGALIWLYLCPSLVYGAPIVSEILKGVILVSQDCNAASLTFFYLHPAF